MGLLVVTGLCALVAVVGLVFLIIFIFQWDTNFSKVKQLSGKINAINNKRPVPVEENKQPIKEDIEVYEKASRTLQQLFGRPLAPATASFFEVLTLKKSMWMPDGIDENDEVVKRLNELSGDQLSSLHNADFDRFLDVIAAEELVKKVRDMASDEEKAKQFVALIPDFETVGDDVLVGRIAAAAKLDVPFRQEISPADLAKRIKALPAGAVPELGSLDEAALTGRIKASADLDAQIQEAGSAADLARQIKELAANDEKAKVALTLIPNAASLGEEELAKKLAVAAELHRQLRETVVARELARRGKSADDAVAKYIGVLIPNAASLDEAELAKKLAVEAGLDRKLREIIPDSDPETLKRLREIPAKFSAEQFLEAYNKIMEGVDEKNYADQRTRFDDFRRDKFENWSAAREAFILASENRQNGPEAAKNGPCIVEKLDAESADEVMLETLGVPRRMSGEVANLKKLMNNILRQLTKEYQVTIVGRAQGLGIISISEGQNSEIGQEGDIQSLLPEDYPAISTHLDIIGYMLYRLGGAGVVVWDVQIRLKASEGENMSGGRRFNESKEQRDGFDIYHYTVELSGTMAQIRDAMSRLDNCYGVRRVYLVRNVALYAENNIVDSVFTGMRVDSRPQTEQNAPAASEGRRRRPRSGANVDAEMMNSDGSNAKLEEQRKLDEEYERRQQQLDVDKRDGYGETIAGGDKDTFRAVIDVEYVVKPAK